METVILAETTSLLREEPLWGMAKHCCCGNPGAPSADNPVVDPLVVNPNP